MKLRAPVQTEQSDRHVRIQQVLCREAQTRRWTDTLSGGCDAQPLAFQRPPDEAASDRHESADHRHRREQRQGPCHRRDRVPALERHPAWTRLKHEDFHGASSNGKQTGSHQAVDRCDSTGTRVLRAHARPGQPRSARQLRHQRTPGSSLRGTFTEAHILAITQAICDYRRSKASPARFSWARTRTRCPGLPNAPRSKF